MQSSDAQLWPASAIQGQGEATYFEGLCAVAGHDRGAELPLVLCRVLPLIWLFAGHLADQVLHHEVSNTMKIAPGIPFPLTVIKHQEECFRV